MAFRVPSVIVYQELLTTTPSLVTPFMDLVVVGPVYQCEDNAATAKYSLSETDYTSAYPNKLLGAIVDPSSVSVSLSDVYVKIWPQDAPVLNAVVQVEDIAMVSVVTASDLQPFGGDIQPGDYMEFIYTNKNTDNIETLILPIMEFTEDNRVLLQRNFPKTVLEEVKEGTLKAFVKRPTKEDVVLEPQFIEAGVDEFKIIAGAQVSSSVVDMAAPVVSADVKVSYRALRTDVANDFMTLTSYAAAQAELGKVNIKNPMSVAASVINSAVGDLTFRVLPVESDDKNGYLKALDILSSNEKAYVIIPLSTDKDIVSAYAAHCTAMSQPEKSKWRITYANMPMPATKVMVEINDGVLAPGLTEKSCYVKDVANGMFMTNFTRVSDYIDVYDSENVYQYSLQITGILNDSVVSVSTKKWERTVEGYVESAEVLELSGDTEVRYEVVRVLDTQGVAEAVSEVAQSFKNKRFRYVQPDQIILNINSVDELVSSEYLCVALGAIRAAFPPHQGMSTMGISGIKRVLRSNKLFNEDQLAEMAGNGVFWVCQDEPEELPYVLYQTTTDTTQLETAEDSCVAVVDYASKFYKDNLKAVLGKYNVNAISLNYVKAVINSCSDEMVSTSYQYIGPILTGANLVAIEAVADKIKPTIKVEIPYPVNGVDIVLQV